MKSMKNQIQVLAYFLLLFISACQNDNRNNFEVIYQLIERTLPGYSDEFILKYMDNLLGDLPEEKIREFSKSKYFSLYKEVFEKLNLT